MNSRWLLLPALLVVALMAWALFLRDGPEKHAASPQESDVALPAEVIAAIEEGGLLCQAWEEYVIAQEADRLGISVTDAQLKERYQRIDSQVRDGSRGRRTIVDVVLQDMKTSVPEFKAGLRYTLLKERVALHSEHLGTLPEDENARLVQMQVVIARLLREHPFPR